MVFLHAVLALVMASQNPAENERSAAPQAEQPPARHGPPPRRAEPDEPAPAPPSTPRLVLAAAAGMGAAALVAVPALLLALGAGLMVGAASGYVAAGFSLMGGLFMLALNPVLMLLLLGPALVAAPWVGYAVMRLAAGDRVGALATVLPGLLAGGVGALVGGVLQLGGAAVGLALLAVIYVILLVAQVLLVACCGAFCGSSASTTIQPQQVTLGESARAQAMAGFALWTLSCVVPAAVGAAVGAVAGPAAGALAAHADGDEAEDAAIMGGAAPVANASMRY